MNDRLAELLQAAACHGDVLIRYRPTSRGGDHWHATIRAHGRRHYAGAGATLRQALARAVVQRRRNAVDAILR